MERKLILGTFDAEKYWRDPHYVNLPSIADTHASNVVLTLDELLFPLCGKNDVLLTRFHMDTLFLEYLGCLGIHLHANANDLHDASAGERINGACVFELLRDADDDGIAGYLQNVDRFDSYAILPQTKEFCRKYNIKYDHPDIEIIKMVNSKIYSNAMHDRIAVKNYGKVARSAEEIEGISRGFAGKQFLIKDAFGVSGKGNILISSQGMLNRILKHISTQEQKGLTSCFVVEPFLDKAIDFSCHIRITSDGKCDIISIQKTYNSGFAYRGSSSAEVDFHDRLEKAGYFDIMRMLSRVIYDDGYYGEMCVDSMVLKDDEIVPIVEINARKSMGLINHYLDDFLKRYSAKGYFFFLSTGINGDVKFEHILNALERDGILFTSARGQGVMPVSCNSMFINRMLDVSADKGKTFKGRLYCTSVAENESDRMALTERVKETLQSISVLVYN
jgi:hypothetical protein